MHPHFIEQQAREHVAAMLQDAASDRLARTAGGGRARTPLLSRAMRSVTERLLDLARLVRRPQIAVEDQPQR